MFGRDFVVSEKTCPLDELHNLVEISSGAERLFQNMDEALIHI